MTCTFYSPSFERKRKRTHLVDKEDIGNGQGAVKEDLDGRVNAFDGQDDNVVDRYLLWS